MYKNVRQDKVPQQIINQIRNSILEGKTKPGDRLASEQELMNDFGVSKSTLREALRTLEYLGLIEIRKGALGGCFVAEVDVEITKENLKNFLHFKDLSVKHMSAIRKNLEPYAAHEAARMISDNDLERLKRINERCRIALTENDFTTLRKKEIEFHRTIAAATQNPILIFILDFIENLLEDIKRILKPGSGFSESVVQSHERVYQALAERDADKAAREMLADVVKVEQGLDQLSKQKQPK